jgi:hypothetical protein
MWTQLCGVALVAAVAASAPAFAQTRPAASRFTGSWEAYPLRGEGFGSGVQPKVRVAAPAPIPEPPLRQPHLTSGARCRRGTRSSRARGCPRLRPGWPVSRKACRR